MTPEESDHEWRKAAAEREVELVEARADYFGAVAAIEKRFAWRLSSRVVDKLVAERDARTPAP